MKQVATYLRTYVAKNPLYTGSISYCLYVIIYIQTQFQLGRYIHACKNETHSLVNIQQFLGLGELLNYLFSYFYCDTYLLLKIFKFVASYLTFGFRFSSEQEDIER